MTEDQLLHRPPREERVLPVALKHGRQPFDVLDGDWLIESPPVNDRLASRQAHAGIEREGLHWAARNQLHSHEQQDADQQERGDGLQEATGYIANKCLTRECRPASGGWHKRKEAAQRPPPVEDDEPVV